MVSDTLGKKKRHEDAARHLLQHALYPLDFFIIAALNRSLCLIRGFCDLIESANMIAAAPLLRLQLDNCLRLSAIWRVSDPLVFVEQVLGGERIDRIKDRDGKPMTDRYLLRKLGANGSWIDKVYSSTSGYVHLSDRLIFNAVRTVGQNNVSMKISDVDQFVPEEMYFEAVFAFTASTELLLETVDHLATEKAKVHQEQPRETS